MKLSIKHLHALLVAASIILSADTIIRWNPNTIKRSVPSQISATVHDDQTVTIAFNTNRIPWPYVMFYPAEGTTWDMSKAAYISFDIENLSPDTSVAGSVKLGAWSKCKIGAFALAPGARKIATFPINHAGKPDFDPMFAGRGMPSGFQGGTNVDTTAIPSIQIICAFAGSNIFKIHKIWTHGDYVPNPAFASKQTFFPFIDDYGQFIHEDWNGKIKSNDDLIASYNKEKAILKPRIATWNAWGGWATGPKLKATGAFRVEKYQGKWYIVDPDGCLFFSRGINSCTQGQYWVTSKGRDCFYTRQPARKDAVFNFYMDNCNIRYQNDSWHDFHFKRMESWGFNTVGNWSNNKLYQARKMPYTLHLPMPATTRINGNRTFWDAFDPAFEAELHKSLKTSFAWIIDDPFCLGIFIGNELRFGPMPQLAELTLASNTLTHAKKAFIQQLKTKYNEIAKLNEAWKTSYQTWDDLHKSIEIAEKNTACKADFEAFTYAFINQFFQVSQRVVKQNAPNRMYIGSRFFCNDYNRIWLLQTAAKYCDIVTINNYALHHDCFDYQTRVGDKPVMITESSVGHSERGMQGILAYPGQAPNARQEALNILLTSVVRNPHIVGIHHFSFKDQTLIGRWDGENFGFGLVDVTDTPYQEFLDAHRAFAEKLYEFRLNSKPAPDRPTLP